MTRRTLAVLAVVLWSAPVNAQNDITGEWVTTYAASEDQPHRVPGPTLGDYTGLPINPAARQKARTWDASILSQPERVAQPHPAQYSLRGGGPNLRISKVIDPLTAQLVAYQVVGFYGRADRVIWMDGRPHPSEHAEHTWGGFSTGAWVGNTLRVRTTHLKMGVIQRNGVPVSPKSRMVEFWTNHGEHLGVFTWIDDPVYLEEPFVRTTDFVRGRDQHVGPAAPFEVIDELGDKPRGWVPSLPLGTEHRDLSQKYGIPYEATQGGRETLYPEYMKTIEALRRKAQ